MEAHQREGDEEPKPHIRATDHSGPAGVLIVTLHGYKYVLAYLILFAAMVAGFLITEAQGDKVERLAENNQKLATALVESNRDGCDRTNTLRENQYQALTEQIAATEATLKKPNGLGPLESFRDQIAAQNAQRKARRADLTVPESAHRDRKKPYLTDCIAAYPIGVGDAIDARAGRVEHPTK